MKEESTEQIAARLAVVARNIQDTASELIQFARMVEEESTWKIDLYQADKIVRLTSNLHTLSLSERIRELSIKAKSIAEVLRDEVYDTPEALKQDEI